ncbi:glycine--tRNA ligase [Candidatus Parcubacteria bacterium]|nr:MAG: glycine--tRNA ligase [Candidatus Parcubacteria bacterium]
MTDRDRMEKIVSLAKRRGFIFPGSELYGGLAGTWDYGPLGTELKTIVRNEWRRRFVLGRTDMVQIESAILMNARVWKASGHLESFTDPMVDCRQCKARFRADKIDLAAACPQCGARDFTGARPFNMMFKTFIGPVEDSAAQIYLRPETAQGMFTNFKAVLDTMRPKLPFGIAQIGKAFRNEITPGNFIFRSREFEQMEIEYFIRPADWEAQFEAWLKEMRGWIASLGLDAARVHEREVAAEDLAHYSKRTVDIDYDFPFGREELYGIAYRTDFDLGQHAQESGADLGYFDEAAKERFVPHVIEPTFGLDRTVLALLLEHYQEEGAKDGTRVVLKFPPRIAPVKVAVFPLLANKPQLVERARGIFERLQGWRRAMGEGLVAWDDRGNIGKRYFSQDEIGTPWCVTVDFQTLEDGTVTVRDRDSAEQERVAEPDLVALFEERLKA